MFFKPSAVHRILISKGVRRLFHVNTVRTACSYLRTGGLWSRGAAELAGLDQTAQGSDEIDREYDIWHDIFLDAAPIHRRGGRSCVYGPVMFDFDVDMLIQPGAHPLRVTRTNPVYWAENDIDADFFRSSKELTDGLRVGDFGQSILVRVAHGPLPLGAYLKGIELDDPETSVGKVDLFSQARGALRTSARAGGFRIKNLISAHQCRSDCICIDQYEAKDATTLARLFSP